MNGVAAPQRPEKAAARFSTYRTAIINIILYQPFMHL
jgi:hypothetical protein